MHLRLEDGRLGRFVFTRGNFLTPCKPCSRLYFSRGDQDLREYMRGVMFTLGRLSHVCGFGLIFMISALQQMVRVDFRTIATVVTSHDLILATTC